MIRVYFVFEDPLDDSGINLSFIDVPTPDGQRALERVEGAAESGELWRNLYPDESEHPYKLIQSKMMCLDISTLSGEVNAETVLPG